MAQEEAEPSIYDTSGATGVRQPVCLCFCIGFICHNRGQQPPQKGGRLDMAQEVDRGWIRL